MNARTCFAATRAEAEYAMISPHRPVMLTEALAGLTVRAGGIYVDATYGRGGHSGEILKSLNGSGTLHSFDQDPQACADAAQVREKNPNFAIHPVNFAQLGEVCAAVGIAGRVDGILFDLGVSSPQLDDAERGFSFMRAGPLDMRMNPQVGESAAQWLAQAAEAEIADVLWRLGEERNSRRIAKRIVAARQVEPIVTTVQLAELVAAAHVGPRQKIHPATRSFQAIRLHINRELDVLPEALKQAVAMLAPGGRLAVISFHSLEDRIVKHFIREHSPASGDDGTAGPPVHGVIMPARRRKAAAPAARIEPSLRAVGRYFPSEAEIDTNPRARSAVLRVAEKLPSTGEVAP